MQQRSLKMLVVLSMLLTTVLACNLTSSSDADNVPVSSARSIQTEVLAPAANSSFKVREPIVVQARLTDPDGTGVTQVELLANNIVVDQKPSQDPNGDKEMTVNLTWDAPVAPGNVTLLVRPWRGSVRATGATIPVTIVDSNISIPTSTSFSSGGSGSSGSSGGGTVVAPTYNPTCRARIDVNRLNFRSSPTTDADNILGYYLLNDEARVLGRVSDNSWYQVKAIVSDAIGWVYGPYTTLLGNCSSVPVIAPPATSAPTVTPSVQPSAQPRKADLVALQPAGLSTLQAGLDGTATAVYNFTVQNIGASQTDNFRIRIQMADGTVVNERLESLGPGQVLTFPPGGLEITFGSPGVHRVTIVVDSGDRVDEENENNNTAYLDVQVIAP